MKNKSKANKKQKSSFRRKDKNLRKKTLKNYRKKSIAKGKKQKGGLSTKQVKDMFGKGNSFANEYVSKTIKPQTGGWSMSNLFSKKSEETKKKEEEYAAVANNNSDKNDEDQGKGTLDDLKEKYNKLQEFTDYVIGIKDIDSQEKLDQSDVYKVDTLVEKWNSLDEIFKTYFVEKKLNVDDIKSWSHKLRSGEKSDLEKLQRAHKELKNMFTGSTLDRKKGEKNISKIVETMKELENNHDGTDEDSISNFKTTLENEFMNASKSDPEEKPGRFSKFTNFMSRKKKDPIDPDMSDYENTTDQKISVDKEKDKYVWIRVNIPKDQSVMVQSDTAGDVDETIRNITEESQSPAPSAPEDDVGNDNSSEKKE